MDIKEYKIRGREMIDYICKYYETISERRVFPSIKPGYLAPLLPTEAPFKPDKWENIMKDVETKIMPGVTHWNHPRFFAYFPAGNSFASFLGDMLSDGIGCIGFSWASSPACTELETIVLDWLGKAINLPSEFLFTTPGSKGGGVIQGSASECVLVCMLAARMQAIKYLKEKENDTQSEDSSYLPQLVAYSSKEAHSCVEKAAKICLVKLRSLPADEQGSLQGFTLKEAIKEDVGKGLHPFFVCGTLGTTSSCSFDNIREIGPIANNLPACWFHVDAAYAGCAFICPEVRHLKEGVENGDSFNTNCNKFLNVCFDCSCLWVKDRNKLIETFSVDPLYLRHDQSENTIDYRHWMIPLSRRFRSLKLWFTLRNFGIEKLQAYIRNHITLAKEFEELVQKDDDFEVTNTVQLGLVCFRLKGSDEESQQLLSLINQQGELHMVPCTINNKFSLRFCIVYAQATRKDIKFAWKIIQKYAAQVRQKQILVSYVSTETDEISSYVRRVPLDIYQTLKARDKVDLKLEGSNIYMPASQTEVTTGKI